MSLLDGLARQMGISTESYNAQDAAFDEELEFERALEAALGEDNSELSEEDVNAILDDDNPDNEVADLGEDDEDASKIADDSLDDDLKSLDSMIAELENELGEPAQESVQSEPATEASLAQGDEWAALEAEIRALECDEGEPMLDPDGEGLAPEAKADPDDQPDSAVPEAMDDIEDDTGKEEGPVGESYNSLSEDVMHLLGLH